MAFMFLAYDEVYSWGRLDDVINSPYAEILPDLFDGTHSLYEINNQLPGEVSALIDSGFIADYLNGDEPQIRAAFQENTLLDWTPVAPLRFYHGDADVTVPYQNSVTAVDSLTANGGVSVELVTIPGGTHETSGPMAILHAINWFESFRITVY
jgi:pimeloyl-ACP methyl ester carboxylesterase